MSSKRRAADASAGGDADHHAPGTPATKAGEVLLRIRADILDGTLRPGEKLGFSMLRDRYSVGTAPIREALIKLASARIVRGEEQRGYRVAPVSHDDLRDLTRVSIGVESDAMARAIERADSTSDIRLVTAFHRLDATPVESATAPGGMSDDWARVHAEFHEALVSSCASPWLMHIRQILFDQTDRYRRLSHTVDGTRDLAGEHRALMTAVLDRDVERAAGLIAAHFGRTADMILQLDGWQEPATS